MVEADEVATVGLVDSVNIGDSLVQELKVSD